MALFALKLAGIGTVLVSVHQWQLQDVRHSIWAKTGSSRLKCFSISCQATFKNIWHLILKSVTAASCCCQGTASHRHTDTLHWGSGSLRRLSGQPQTPCGEQSLCPWQTQGGLCSSGLWSLWKYSFSPVIFGSIHSKKRKNSPVEPRADDSLFSDLASSHWSVKKSLRGSHCVHIVLTAWCRESQQVCEGLRALWGSTWQNSWNSFSRATRSALFLN